MTFTILSPTQFTVASFNWKWKEIEHRRELRTKRERRGKANSFSSPSTSTIDVQSARKSLNNAFILGTIFGRHVDTFHYVLIIVVRSFYAVKREKLHNTMGEWCGIKWGGKIASLLGHLRLISSSVHSRVLFSFASRAIVHLGQRSRKLYGK